MQFLDFLFSRPVIMAALLGLTFYYLMKIEPEEPEDEPEDIEAYIAGFDQAETPDQVIRSLSAE